MASLDRRVLVLTQDTPELRSVLSGVRSLQAAGWTVGIGSRQAGLATRSRSVRYWHHVPPPSEDLDAFVTATQTAIRDRAYDLVVGGSDAEVLALAASRESLGTWVPYPPLSAAIGVHDKLDVVDDAIAAGLHVPHTQLAEPEALANVSGPVLVKSRLHWKPGMRHVPGRQTTTLVFGREEAARRAAEIRAAGGEPILQEYLEGQELAFAVVIDREGSSLAEVQQTTEWTWPPGAGTWSRAETRAIDPQLARQVASFLTRRGWFGLTHLQFIVPPSGAPHLIDVNGRFYASMGLAIKAGADLPAVWVDALGPFAPLLRVTATRARANVRYVCLENDLQRAWVERRGGLAADLVGLARYQRGAVHSLWRRNDPMPALYSSILLARRAGGHLIRRGRRRARGG
ncbi:MAG: hypothetical protein M3373_06560 [Gemmatimonadota bacterium]|nr:hypothetical protein [Gemmatimonadota bacterium]